MRHGSIINCGGAGLDLSHCFNVRVSDLIVGYNGGAGIVLGDTCSAANCTSHDNNGDNSTQAIVAPLPVAPAVGSVIGYGINLGQDGHISGCVANFNKMFGSSPGLEPRSRILR